MKNNTKTKREIQHQIREEIEIDRELAREQWLEDAVWYEEYDPPWDGENSLYDLIAKGAE